MDFIALFNWLSSFYYSSAIWFFIAANSFYGVILWFGFINARKRYFEQITEISSRLQPLKSLKPISILVPCYNEENTVVDSLSSMLRLDYPDYEVIVCNDGSKDNTLTTLMESFQLVKISTRPPQTLPSAPIRGVYRSALHGNLIVVDKENGGKADALNCAINFSQYPLICCVDSDSMIDREGLKNVAMPFLESPEVIATGGTILLVNTQAVNVRGTFSEVNTSVTPSWMGMVQAIEYLRAFLVGRLGWDYIHCDPIISGAFGLFRKSLVIKVGGYLTKTIGEDMELILRMQSYCLEQKVPYRVRLLPVPVCWTEPPSDLETLGNQRIRWTQGLAECLWLHRRMLFRPWAGQLGMVGLPYYFLFELLSAPIEILGYLFIMGGLYLVYTTDPQSGLSWPPPFFLVAY